MPLHGHELFKVERPDELQRMVETELAGRFENALIYEGRLSARADFYRLPTSELWFCDYGIPLRLAFDASDYVRVQFRYAGVGATSVRGEKIAVTERQACVSSGATVIDFAPGFRQLVWRVGREQLARKLVALTGLALPHTLEFAPTVDLQRPEIENLSRTMGFLLQAIDSRKPRVNALILRELEQALIVALLCGCRHNCQGLLDRSSGTAAPWQVQRVEQYLEQYWDQPVSIEDIAAATGASVRTSTAHSEMSEAIHRWSSPKPNA